MSLGLIAAIAAAATGCAQMPVPGMGGGKSGGGDPRKIEADLKRINEVTLTALGQLAQALGLKETAAKMGKNADDIRAGTVGLPDATSIVSEASESVTAEMEKFQKEGKKLDAASSAAASRAILPGIQAFPLWKSVADGGRTLDRGSLLGAASLAQALPKVPTAAKNTIDMFQASVRYLSFSGADTSALEKEVKAKLSF
jgi:hypothetical protein